MIEECVFFYLKEAFFFSEENVLVKTKIAFDVYPLQLRIQETVLTMYLKFGIGSDSNLSVTPSFLCKATFPLFDNF